MKYLEQETDKNLQNAINILINFGVISIPISTLK